MLDLLLVGLALAVAVALLRRSLRDLPMWRATVTPLASIIGSGFLIAGPLLAHIVGPWAPVAMLGILLAALGIGSVIRFNIAHGETLLKRPDCPFAIEKLQRASDLVLALAYVVSVAFYVRLLASFVLRMTALRDPVVENVLTTVVLLSIASVGWLRGLGGLERMEEVAVAIKLAIIAALLVGLFGFDISWLGSGESLIEITVEGSNLDRIRSLAGLLLIVQGFETSRYLGDSYGSSMRIRSMRLAQIVAGIVYMLFVILGLPLLAEFHGVADETGIISMAERVAVLLPGMLVIAAVMSQFSAAVADTAGAGGLLHELSESRVSARHSYVWLILTAIVLVWTANVFEIVTLASRAFAAYYMLQCLVAIGVCLTDKSRPPARRGVLVVAMGLAAATLAAVVLFALPVA